MERKDFLKATLALCGMSVIPAAIIESCSKQSFSGPQNVNFTLDLTAASNSALNAVGGYLLSNGVLVIRESSGFVAFSATCTHQGCTVGYDASSAKIICPCHGGMYNSSTGAVISGPPPSGLAKYTTSLSGNILTVKS